MLTYHQRGPQTFSWRHFQNKCTYRWVSAKKTSLKCVSNGIMSFLHYPSDIIHQNLLENYPCLWLRLGDNELKLPPMTSCREWGGEKTIVSNMIHHVYCGNDEVLPTSGERSHPANFLNVYSRHPGMVIPGKDCLLDNNGHWEKYRGGYFRGLSI